MHCSKFTEFTVMSPFAPYNRLKEYKNIKKRMQHKKNIIVVKERHFGDQENITRNRPTIDA